MARMPRPHKPIRRDPATVHLATVEAAAPAQRAHGSRSRCPRPRLAPDSASSMPWSHTRRPTRRCAGAPTEPRSCGTSSSSLPAPPRPPSRVGEQLAQLEQAIRKDRVLSGVGRLGRHQSGNGRPQRRRDECTANPRPNSSRLTEAVDDAGRPEHLGCLQRGRDHRRRWRRPGPAASQPTGRVPAAPGPG